MRTLIVIVNYRTADLVIDCLASLEPEIARLAAQGHPTEVAIADNASGDGSADKIAAAIAARGWSRWATSEALPNNGGFSYGNNAMIRPRLASFDLLHLLNPDTVIHPGAVEQLVLYAQQHPQVGIFGSRLEDPDGTPQRSAFRFHTVWSELDLGLRLGVVSRLVDRYVVAPPVEERAHETDWVSGASMLVRREVFEAIGLMDEDYFLYFEEVDLCLRARRAGWACHYVPASRVVHLVAQATGVTDNAKSRPKRRPAYWFESRRRYFAKNHGELYRAAADVAFAGGLAAFRLRQRLQAKADQDPPQLWRDFVRYALARSKRRE